jgi:hypothetical protein
LAVNHMLLVALYMSTTAEKVAPPSGVPPPNTTISPIEAAARSVRAWLSVAVLHICVVALKMSTKLNVSPPLLSPPPKKAKLPSDAAARYQRS